VVEIDSVRAEGGEFFGQSRGEIEIVLDSLRIEIILVNTHGNNDCPLTGLGDPLGDVPSRFFLFVWWNRQSLDQDLVLGLRSRQHDAPNMWLSSSGNQDE